MRRFVFVVLLCGAARFAWAAACAESPSGQQNCETFSARDQNALATPLPNYLRLSGNNGASVPAVPTPNTGECVWGDTTTASSTTTQTRVCEGSYVERPKTDSTTAVVVQNASATPVVTTDTTNKILTVNGQIAASSMNIPRPYGTYYTITPVPTPASTTAAYAIAFDGEAESGITHPYSADNSKVQITQAGTYVIEISAIVDLVAAPAGHIDLWLAVNGNNVEYSNTKVEIPNASTEFTLAVPLMYTFAANDYFQIMYAVDDVDVQIRQVPKTPSRTPAIPDAPAIIISVFKVSGN